MIANDRYNQADSQYCIYGYDHQAGNQYDGNTYDQADGQYGGNGYGQADNQYGRYGYYHEANYHYSGNERDHWADVWWMWG